jgi:hypothetical protein
MRSRLFWRVSLLAFLSGCGGTPAAPWCARHASDLTECSFYSYEQRTKSLSGVGVFARPIRISGGASNWAAAIYQRPMSGQLSAGS